MKLIIHAPNIHTGGGLTLLRALLNHIETGVVSFLILDRRLPVDFQVPEGASTFRVTPTIWGRFMAEKKLLKIAASNDVVLSFGNLPPLYRLNAQVLVFLQNRYLIESASLAGFKMSARLRIFIERHWLLSRKVNADQFIVQTGSMLRAVKDKLSMPTVMWPFIEKGMNYRRRGGTRIGHDAPRYDFVYVASGEPHKHHRQLVGAWTTLAKEGIRPSLVLTLCRQAYPELCHWIAETAAREHLNVINLGERDHRQMAALYGNCRALIHPSTLETIGLPLIEARQAGLPILAGELDYVRDVVDPEETFDPHSPVSIARAVKRFLMLDEPPLPICSPSAFLNNILSVSER